MNNRIYGNRDLISFFETAHRNNKLSHAYIIEGEKGSGKHLFANYAACLLNCRSLAQRPCFVCESCRKTLEGVNPDVIRVGVEGDKKLINAETARRIRSDVYVSPNEEDRKIYIISDAECMNVQAQNIFLKTLEEPPANVYFLLLCSNPANILPTVRSRAPSLKMQIFSDGELKQYLTENYAKARSIPEKELDLIVRISGGRIGEALSRLEETGKSGDSSARENAAGFIDLLLKQKNVPRSLVFLKKKIRTREDGTEILFYCRYALRDVAVSKKTRENTKLLFYGDVSEALSISDTLTNYQEVTLNEEFEDAYSEIQLNANTDNLFTDLICKVRRILNGR